MIAPTTLAGAAILSAAKMNGSAAWKRSLQSTVHRPAAYERMSSSLRGSTDVSPRMVLIVTGRR